MRAILCVLVALSPAYSAESIAAATKPNIVLIMADDMGYGDVRSLNPHSKIPTPHLDKLANEGMTFVDAHSPSAVCTPTRYALLTGPIRVAFPAKTRRAERLWGSAD